MEHNPVLEELRTFTNALQVAGADRNTVELAQHVLAVLDWVEERLDMLDDREGA